MLQIKQSGEKSLALTQLRIPKFPKKHLKPLPLLVVIILSTFTFANSLFFSTVNATYIEGPITQDTIWTLTDSPFVVSKDITVYPNATLTIEPGVEVMFGGGFSLIVNGRLIATGTQDKMIKFTSNKDPTEPGDWNTIEFSGTEQSTLSYCSIKYAKNGITIGNGNVKIENCEIESSLENGIAIVDSTAEIKNNKIAYNLQSGILVTGDNQVTIENNNISSNGDGILLTGTSISGVDISQNLVLSNTQSGIHLDAEAYSDVTILHNILSANNRGFHVSGQANTYITNNSISYNTLGIFYEQAQGHEAHWNDIYGNEFGIDVAYGAAVNAIYNYWGDESGPYHASLNPAGKGNPVGGDGVNIDFIFFLTAPIDHINERPTAELLTDKTVVPPNQPVTFIATPSSDDGRVDQYFFDFGDGANSGWTTLSIFVHKYSSVGPYNTSVTVMDDFGVTSDLATVMIDVQDLPPLEVSLIPNSYTVGSEEQVSVTVYVTDGANAVEGADITLFSVIGGSFTPPSGLTNSTGYFTATFSAPNVPQIANVRITATASKTDYADGSDYKYLMVLPTLLVQLTAPDTIISEAISNVTVQVTYSGAPVSDATVTMSSDGGGSFDQEIGTTDTNGECVFNFTAPQVTTLTNVTITATATKTGYADGTNQKTITVNPRTLDVQVTANPATVDSKATSTVTVHVTYNAEPVANVTVTVSSDAGETFSITTGTTDENGLCSFVFTAPQTTAQSDVTVTATVTKSGYADGQGQTVITVNPVSLFGLPLTTILIIAAVIGVIVVILVLIKLKIIVIGKKEV